MRGVPALPQGGGNRGLETGWKPGETGDSHRETGGGNRGGETGRNRRNRGQSPITPNRLQAADGGMRGVPALPQGGFGLEGDVAGGDAFQVNGADGGTMRRMEKSISTTVDESG